MNHPSQQPKNCETHEAVSIHDIISVLWNRATPELSKNELEWFRKSGETAQASLGNFAAVLKAIGTNTMRSEQPEAFKSNEAISRMLFFFSDYMRYLETMVSIAGFAGDQLGHDR